MNVRRMRLMQTSRQQNACDLSDRSLALIGWNLLWKICEARVNIIKSERESALNFQSEQRTKNAIQLNNDSPIASSSVNVGRCRYSDFDDSKS